MSEEAKGQYEELQKFKEEVKYNLQVCIKVVSPLEENTKSMVHELKKQSNEHDF